MQAAPTKFLTWQFSHTHPCLSGSFIRTSAGAGRTWPIHTSQTTGDVGTFVVHREQPIPLNCSVLCGKGTVQSWISRWYAAKAKYSFFLRQPRQISTFKGFWYLQLGHVHILSFQIVRFTLEIAYGTACKQQLTEPYAKNTSSSTCKHDCGT